MADYTRQVLRLLSAAGCYFVRLGKGSHTIWFSPMTNRPFTVAAKIGNRRTANGILKDAGMDAKV
ncbi:MAG: type II toxin-antitoxin system HicA family toxin [Oscillospiraceae bacterium]|jgi:predicted RNA binding protein YcfA (HicA-like mRNA interferase family)|nr:type II toxin-antitoxin system HicA family toxin [Oscillospiraceae bacterium]